MDIKPQIRAYVTKNFYIPDGSALSDNASLLDRGVIDSTGVLEVISFLEETFSIAVLDNETLPENLDSIDRIAAYVERKQAQGA